MLLVNEMFYSIQGEATQFGTPQIFLRFSKCNLACRWCDTEFDSVAFKASPEELVKKVNQLVPPNAERHIWINLTGGEPTIQHPDNMEELIDILHSQGYKITIETNGIKYPNWMGKLDWTTVSPKYLNKDDETDFPDVDEQIYTKYDELKLIVGNGEVPPKFIHPARNMFIQPQWGNPESEMWCINFIKDNPKWRLSIQAHKITGIP